MAWTKASNAYLLGVDPIMRGDTPDNADKDGIYKWKAGVSFPTGVLIQNTVGDVFRVMPGKVYSAEPTEREPGKYLTDDNLRLQALGQYKPEWRKAGKDYEVGDIIIMGGSWMCVAVQGGTTDYSNELGPIPQAKFDSEGKYVDGKVIWKRILDDEQKGVWRRAGLSYPEHMILKCSSGCENGEIRYYYTLPGVTGMREPRDVSGDLFKNGTLTLEYVSGTHGTLKKKPAEDEDISRTSRTVYADEDGYGVKKISEKVMRKGRSLLIVDKEEPSYEWDDLQPGTLRVDPDFGNLYAKLRGQDHWVRINVGADNTNLDINATFQTELDDLISRLTKAEKDIKANRTDIAKNQGDILELKKELAALKKQVASNTTRIDDLVKQLNDLKDSIDSRFKTVTNNIQNIISRIERLESKVWGGDSGSAADIRTIHVANGVSASSGKLLAYQAGGFVLADNRNLDKLQDVVLTIEATGDNKRDIKVFDYGSLDAPELKVEDGSILYVGESGNVTNIRPTGSDRTMKIIGYVENQKIIFKPDTVSMQLYTYDDMKKKFDSLDEDYSNAGDTPTNTSTNTTTSTAGAASTTTASTNTSTTTS